ncbi:hypothetical protein KFL_001390270 [Klebsormidium nitens]|uniref:Uncharacterized protein n=1 Tax=Klebsormidium nitens TaxID=105231 RepID=A0A1Y1I190_KLENI|nr:hypothetical protein KFL_001390270 [Klebsormidium nitens]|eukprot:GAQ83209.1 hypothetical protein KFL_001390270 [Klebsormidium nitens]
MAARHLLGVLRSLTANPGEHLSHAAAARAYASSALLRTSPASAFLGIQSAWDRAFSTDNASSSAQGLGARERRRAKERSRTAVQPGGVKERVPFELQEGGGKGDQDLDLQEPTGIFHIYDREEPNEKDEDDPGVPWGTISLTGPPPDYLSPSLSTKSKNAIYAAYKEDPSEKTVAKLAADYKILKQRVQAILFLKEREEVWEKEVLEKQDDETKEMFKEMDEVFDSEASERGGGERLWLPMATRMKPKLVVENDEYEADAVVSTSGMSWDKASERYEGIEYLEFLERLQFNRRLGEVKAKAEDRKRPDEGWTFLIEELGKEGKRGKGGGKRFVAKADGTRRPLNDLEKLMMKRETPKRRKFDFL